MSDFEVIDKDYLNTPSRIVDNSPTEKGMLGFLLKKGIVKSESVGNYVLIGVAVFFILMSVLAFYIL